MEAEVTKWNEPRMKWMTQGSRDSRRQSYFEKLNEHNDLSLKNIWGARVGG